MLLVESGGKGERKDLINSVSKLPYSMNWLIGSIVVIPSIVSQDWKYHPLGTLWHSQGALTPLKAIGWYQTGFAWAKAESEKRSRCSCLTHSMHSSLQEKSALRTDTHYLLESQSSLSQKLSARLGQGFGKVLSKAGLFPRSNSGIAHDWHICGLASKIIGICVDRQGSLHQWHFSRQAGIQGWHQLANILLLKIYI